MFECNASRRAIFVATRPIQTTPGNTLEGVSSRCRWRTSCAPRGLGRVARTHGGIGGEVGDGSSTRTRWRHSGRAKCSWSAPGHVRRGWRKQRKASVSDRTARRRTSKRRWNGSFDTPFERRSCETSTHAKANHASTTRTQWCAAVERGPSVQTKRHANTSTTFGCSPSKTSTSVLFHAQCDSAYDGTKTTAKKKYLRGIPPTCGDDSKEVTRSRLCLVPTGKTTPFATCTEWHSQSRSDGTGFGEHRNELAFLVQADRVVAASHVFAADEHVWNRPLSRPVMQSRLKRTSVRFRFEVADGNVRKGFEGRVQAQDPSFRSSSCALARSSRDLGGVFRARSELHVHI